MPKIWFNRDIFQPYDQQVAGFDGLVEGLGGLNVLFTTLAETLLLFMWVSSIC